MFDVCPSPPLTWSEFACRNVMDLARARVPAELISMPLAGVASPVTLIGSIVQHAAETLAGIVLHQLAEAGSPIVWGGAPTIVDMRSGSTPMGAIETAMIDAGYAAVGKSLGLPCHAYLGATDSKLVDAQAGYESGMTALIGGLAGIDMISGPGMLDFLLAQSPEKLVIDAEMIGMVQRLLRGVATPTETLATGSFEAAGPEGRFLELQETRKLFRTEQYLPSRVFDRNSRRAWLDAGGLDAYGRAHERVEEIMATHVVPALAPEVASGLVARVREAGAPFGLGDALPGAPAGWALGVRSPLRSEGGRPGDAPGAASPGMLRSHVSPSCRALRRGQHLPVSGRPAPRSYRGTLLPAQHRGRRVPAPGPVPGNAASGAGSADVGPRAPGPVPTCSGARRLSRRGAISGN